METAPEVCEPRVRTPPLLDSTPVRALTPEPAQSHWIFAKEFQGVLKLRCIPFTIKGIRESDDTSMHGYEGDPAKTVLADHCKTLPREGEIIMNVVHRRRRQQISINPKYLLPLEPVRGGEVVVIKGVWIGMMGKAKERKEKDWVVTFSAEDDSAGFTFQEKELASIEAYVTK